MSRWRMRSSHLASSTLVASTTSSADRRASVDSTEKMKCPVSRPIRTYIVRRMRLLRQKSLAEMNKELLFRTRLAVVVVNVLIELEASRYLFQDEP